MKKTLLLLFSLTACFFADAQINKGRVLLGGGFDVGARSRNYQGTYNYIEQERWSVYPSVSYFYKQNRSFGVNLSYGEEKSTYTTADYERISSWGAGISLNRYFPIGKSFFVAAHGAFDFEHTQTRSNYSGGSSNRADGNGFSARLYPGVGYLAGNRFLFEAGLTSVVKLYYRHSTQRTNGSPANERSGSHDFGLSTSLGESNPLFISFNILLGK